MNTKTIIAFVYFLIAAVFGLLMRISVVENLGFNYKYLLHTHSHIALLGWLYNLALIFIGHYFFKKDIKRFNLIFWVSQTTFLGMLFSFPFQGYAFWSIGFSTLYLFASYWLIYQIFSSSKKLKYKFEYKLLRAGAFFLFLSSIGPFALGAILAKGLQHTIWYNLSIYWFLHFLFNGFLYIVLLVLLISEVKKKISISASKISWVYYLTVFSIIPLYAGFAIEPIPSKWILAFSFLSSLSQLISVMIIYNELKLYLVQISNNIQKLLLGLSLLALFLKMVFQLFASFPFLHEMVFSSKSTIIIGYLHMVMLAMFSLFFVWLLVVSKVAQLNQLFKTGVIVLIGGIVLSEVVLFTQGVGNYFWQYSLPNYYVLLYVVSGLIPVGILVMLTSMVFLKIRQH